MIKLDNVSKTYVSKKSKSKVRALKNVSFELSSRGMVFILGKSGSGKSTLLHLLGGLDAPTSGSITVDGVSMESFKRTDYDAYRNGYVGFVFQDFNLLNDFNVRDNVALALQLANASEIDAKVKDALAQVELSDEYLTRRVGELSGGERQRVAIARSLIKDSKLILADEPTGNLDSKTGESIWHLLKKLSEKKLVVVVSHDRESAAQYGDRIIEISDGAIVSDNGAQSAVDVDEQHFTPKRNSLPLKTSVKMGLNSVLQRKGKSVSVILVAMFTILTLIITQMGLTFSPERTYAQFIKQYDVPYINMSQETYFPEGVYQRDSADSVRYGALKYISERTDYIYDGVVENKQQLLDFGFTFVGEALELTENSYYTTRYNLEKLDYLNTWYYNTSSYYVDDEGDKIKLALGQDRLPMTELIGKPVYLQSCGFPEPSQIKDTPILAGVLDVSDESDFFVSVPSFFARSDFTGYDYSLNTAVNYAVSEYQLSLGANSYDGQFDIATVQLRSTKMRTFISLDGELLVTKSIDEVRRLASNLADDDIVLSYALYAKLFGAKSQSYYVGSEQNELLNVPDRLGERFSLKIYDKSGNVLADLGEYRLAAVGFDGNDSGNEEFSLVTSVSARVNLNGQLHFGDNILVKTDKITNLSGFLLKLKNDYKVYVSSVGGMHFDVKEVNIAGVTITAGMIGNGLISDRLSITIDSTYIVDSFVKLMQTFVLITGVLCAASALILLLLVINLISFSIAARKKEIGILSALGTPTRDVTRIFVFETLVIGAVTFVLTLILAVVFALVFNTVYCGAFEYTLPLFKVDIFTLLTLVAASFGLLLLAALIPIRKISKLKPIDAIRHI